LPLGTQRVTLGLYKNPDAMSIRICNPIFTLDRASLANQVYPLTIYPLTRYILLSKKNKKNPAPCGKPG